jgi:bleomycin hydrolase
MKNASIKGTIVIAASALILSASPLIAGDGALTTGLIEQVRTSFEMDVHTKAMYNAITNNDIKSLALNRDILHNHNEVFSNKIKAKGVTNQKSTGRCWLFAGLNIMRPAVIEKYKLSKFEFSQNYLAFWDKMEKANCFLEQIIEFRDRDPLDREMEILLRSPFPDGGWWHYVVDLIEKYGVVPKETMPETRSSENTGMMNRLIGTKLRADAIELRDMNEQGKSVDELRTEKENMLAEVYKMLAMNLGEPPTEFPWRFEDRDSVVSEMKMFTPREFYEEFVGVDLNQYVNVFNDPTKEFGKFYQIRMSRNMYDRDDVSYANVEIGVLSDAAMKSVLDDEPVWFACDVGKDQNGEHGIMAMDIYDYQSIYNTEMSMTKAERALYRQSAPNHAMVFVGVDVKDDMPVKWLVENSWGKKKGSDGYWTLYDTWFDNHVYNVIVKKEFVSQEVLDIYKQDPIILPPWDPMYSLFR